MAMGGLGRQGPGDGAVSTRCRAEQLGPAHRHGDSPGLGACGEETGERGPSQVVVSAFPGNRREGPQPRKRWGQGCLGWEREMV